jgi:NAD(P)-dependent dehydrogenase (short-subunit alcohol dehydrogenase family)
LKQIIITGSEGYLGSSLCKFFKKKYKILKLDIKLGHDLTDEKFVKKWFKDNKSNYLINCFALNDHVNSKRKNNTLFEFPLSSFSNYLNVNLTSLFSVCREFARNNKQGSIVNFSSYLGLVSPRPDIYGDSHKDIGYTISKFGVIGMTKYLAVHLAPKIRVNCISPGGIYQNQSKEFIKKYSKLTPMGRMMEKEEVNGLVDYLCSDKSSYATGENFVMDGGYVSW